LLYKRSKADEDVKSARVFYTSFALEIT
jgi:hypothetical protein